MLAYYLYEIEVDISGHRRQNAGAVSDYIRKCRSLINHFIPAAQDEGKAVNRIRYCKWQCLYLCISCRIAGKIGR